ncbi:alpha/beta fold hydrolase [Streptomyces sp. NPDC059863]|uniref:alpha/beta fold hydrolase n=1 Tax=unclassified Streptomyces TaxID=2593676 RepID=UPI003668E217
MPQGDGYPVLAPANPLRGLSSDAPYLAGLLKSIKGPVILAGHSYGGAVITNAAAGNPNVKALVYVAAFVPDEGEQLIGLLGKYPGREIPDPYRPPCSAGSTTARTCAARSRCGGLRTPSWSATPARWRSSSRRPTAPRAEPARPPREQAR